jgi:hypothetical protein
MAGCTFVAGSVCFLPIYARDVHTFLWGCVLFIIGSILYVVVCFFCLFEALLEKGAQSFDFYENVLYLVGGTIFTVGSVLYMPDEDKKCILEEGEHECAAISQEVNKYDKEFFGSVLFIAGSFVFALAAFVNAVGQRRYDLWTHNMLSLITGFYLCGSMLFAMGSMCFLPDLGCDQRMVGVGAWMFIFGSILFLAGSLFSLWRTSHIYSQEGAADEEANKSLSHSAASMIMKPCAT